MGRPQRPRRPRHRRARGDAVLVLGVGPAEPRRLAGDRSAQPADPPRARLRRRRDRRARGRRGGAGAMSNGRGRVDVDLSGKVALVTGGSRGLGKEMVQAFAAAGADVVISSRKQEACDELAAVVRGDTGRTALAVAAHVGRWDDVDRLVDVVYGELGRVDILVNNAGMAPLYPRLSACSEELFDKTIAVNLKGPFRLGALIGERMVAGDGG